MASSRHVAASASTAPITASTSVAAAATAIISVSTFSTISIVIPVVPPVAAVVPLAVVAALKLPVGLPRRPEPTLTVTLLAVYRRRHGAFLPRRLRVVQIFPSRTLLTQSRRRKSRVRHIPVIRSSRRSRRVGRIIRDHGKVLQLLRILRVKLVDQVGHLFSVEFVRVVAVSGSVRVSPKPSKLASGVYL